MKITRLLIIVFALALLLPACGGGNNGDGNVDFTAFVKQLLANTSDHTDPEEINEIQFQFNEDENAFDDVLQ